MRFPANADPRIIHGWLVARALGANSAATALDQARLDVQGVPVDYVPPAYRSLHRDLGGFTA